MMASNGDTSKMHQTRRIVVKLGTNLVTLENGGLDESTLAELGRQMAELRLAGNDVILVSSGAVGAGQGMLAKMGQTRELRRQRSLRSRQAAAAMGQVELMAQFRRIFGLFGIDIAQALISRHDLNNRSGYLNIRNALERLLYWRVIPIVNENDVVGAEDLEGVLYGDNDRLSAMLANALDADLLVLLGEADGLYTADPNRNPNAELISHVDELTEEIQSYAGGPSDDRGSGGMRSKLEAADVAMASGIDMVIANGYEPDVLKRILSEESVGTRFSSPGIARPLRKRRLMTGGTESRGDIFVDDGAVHWLTTKGASLLPAGITDVEGEFERGDIVSVKSPDGSKVAFGIVNYDAEDVKKVAGLHTTKIPKHLARRYGIEIIHRDYLAMSTPHALEARSQSPQLTERS